MSIEKNIYKYAIKFWGKKVIFLIKKNMTKMREIW